MVKIDVRISIRKPKLCFIKSRSVQPSPMEVKSGHFPESPKYF
jgi:hypothetical protein